MAAAASPAFDFNSLAQTMGLGKQVTDLGDGANEKTTLDLVFDAAGDHLVSLGGKPFNLNAKDLPGITKSLEPPDTLGSSINKYAQSFSAGGSWIYKAFIAPLMKRAFEGVGGSAHGEGGGSEGGSGGGGGEFASSGGSSGGGGGDFASSGMDYGSAPAAGGHHAEPMTIDYGGKQYAVSNMSEAALGNLAPSSGVAPLERGEGVGIS